MFLPTLAMRMALKHLAIHLPMRVITAAHEVVREGLVPPKPRMHGTPPPSDGKRVNAPFSTHHSADPASNISKVLTCTFGGRWKQVPPGCARVKL